VGAEGHQASQEAHPETKGDDEVPAQQQGKASRGAHGIPDRRGGMPDRRDHNPAEHRQAHDEGSRDGRDEHHSQGDGWEASRGEVADVDGMGRERHGHEQQRSPGHGAPHR
jgi:hypothetical protein